MPATSSTSQDSGWGYLCVRKYTEGHGNKPHNLNFIQWKSSFIGGWIQKIKSTLYGKCILKWIITIFHLVFKPHRSDKWLEWKKVRLSLRRDKAKSVSTQLSSNGLLPCPGLCDWHPGFQFLEFVQGFRSMILTPDPSRSLGLEPGTTQRCGLHLKPPTRMLSHCSGARYHWPQLLGVQFPVLSR